MKRDVDASVVPISDIQEIADLLSKKWRLRLLYALQTDSPCRFSELKQQFDISSKMLTTSLNDLTEAGVLERRAQNDSHVTYTLTEAGVNLLALTDTLGTWVEQYPSHANPRVLVVNSDPRLAQLFTDWLTPKYEVGQVIESHQLDGAQLDDADIVLFHYHPLGEIDLSSIRDSSSDGCDYRLIVIAPSKRKLAESGLHYHSSLIIPIQTEELQLCVKSGLDSSNSQ